MNNMNMPGFTAECALYKNHQHHPINFTIPTDPQAVTPAMRPSCFRISFVRTYNRCVGLGYGSGTCAQLALDLAESVC
jgi:hypothetical protein